MNRLKTIVRNSLEERGSALLVTLMVIVGLSMLGLGFVAMSETESAISVNQRNYSQAQVISEAGARIVVDWFNQPERMDGLGLMPAPADRAALMQTRWLDVDNDGAETDEGIWKDGAEFFCCDKPYRPSVGDRLYGTFWSPDVVIDESTTEGEAFLASLNDALFPHYESGGVTLPGSYSGEISEIRIYAPPIIGNSTDTPNDANGTMPAGQGFYDPKPAGGNEGVRYGLATVAVTAQVRRLPRQALSVAGNRVLSERTTRVVVSEWPFPGPQGPIQSNANIQTGGSVVVHWGKMTSQEDMFVKREFQGIPHLDPHQRIPWWYGGNNTSREWSAGLVIQAGDVVRPTNAVTAADHNYYAVNAGTTAGPEPVWPATGSVVDAGGITWTRRNPAQFKMQNAAGASDWPVRQWGFDLLGRSFEDPWVEARARGAITNAPNTNPEPYDWDYTTVQSSILDPTPKKSHWFQNQDHSCVAPCSYKEVVFPKIDYIFWKELAIAGQGTEGVHYFRWVAGDTFSKNGVTNTFKAWTNTFTGAEPGFYFFDTMNQQNPQVTGGEAFLTPAIQISGAGGNTWTASGFIYLNTEEYGTTGISGVDGYFNFPGELYYDGGFFRVDETASPMVSTNATDASDVGNRKWNYQDVNGNGVFDLYLAQRTITRLDGTPVANVWMPVYWYEGCTVADNAHTGTVTAGGCSEPHEPYYNLQYPADACCAGLLPNPITVGWFNPTGTVTKRPKDLLPDDSLPDCTTNTTRDNLGNAFRYCTSNYYDRDGELDWWAGAQDAPVLNGVMYIEGIMSSQGNARYFGSLLINGNVDNTGTNEVWFDERLIKDEWPPSDWPFPRVFVSAVRTDDL